MKNYVMIARTEEKIEMEYQEKGLGISEVVMAIFEKKLKETKQQSDWLNRAPSKADSIDITVQKWIETKNETD